MSPPVRTSDLRHDPRDAWYHDGLAFECTQCGACCTGSPGIVRFTPDEAQAIARRLRLTLEQFLERCTHESGLPGERSLNEVETEFGLDCVFLDRTTVPGKAVCGIYEVRPLQCRTFPWWPEHLSSARAWQRLGRTCEGVGRGGMVSASEIRISAQRHANGNDRTPHSGA